MNKASIYCTVSLCILLLCINKSTNAQMLDSCRLQFGTNLSGVFDWSTDLPFVDMMRNCREWYSKDNSGSFESGQIANMRFRVDGYPTKIPQLVAGEAQRVATIWAKTDGWEPGSYIVLFDGMGTLHFDGVDAFLQTSPNRYVFDFYSPIGKEVQMIIQTSDSIYPVHNIRIVKNTYEFTHATSIFNPHWIQKLLQFKTVRFMDWGHTNHWGQSDQWNWDNPGLVDWSARAKYTYYTWTTSKGIPYEVMIELMNSYELDAWVCVPHRADSNYIYQMATLFKNQVHTNRHLYVEYSNEIWNTIMGQSMWLDEYACIRTGAVWPECLVPYIQNNARIWTSVYTSELHRITRVVGAFTGWLDVSERIAYNMDPSTYDAIAPTFYFGFSVHGDSILDNLGSSARISDVALQARSNFSYELNAIRGIKQLCDSLNKQLLFYEGGNHMTAIPFGDTCTYSAALVGIHRDTAIYNLYNEWLSHIQQFQSGTAPLLCMNFSFIAQPTIEYGCWGIWESLYQDTIMYPPYKVYAIRNFQGANCNSTTTVSNNITTTVLIYPNPADNSIYISSDVDIEELVIYTLQGTSIYKTKLYKTLNEIIHTELWQQGMYIVKAGTNFYKIIIKH